MLRKLKLLIVPFSILLTFSHISTLASSLGRLPSSIASDQWNVIIGKADSENQKENKSDRPDIYNVYSMDIKNIGDKNVNLVRIEAYRDEPNIKTEYELFTTESNRLLTPSFHHNNFPLSTKATKLKVVVTWTKEDRKNSQRKYQEEFIFNQ
ncbi:hypothetical protein [Bacillus sp. 03113]|uniref:hypothetical protein n=1 Tax=Bacillus sp. 03113 TaxID=2578211 RepID=UPI001142D4DF|nr:hypothetical protein [Bacillus sp. 03113]